MKSKVECEQRARLIAGSTEGAVVYLYQEQDLIFGSLAIPMDHVPSGDIDFLVVCLEKDLARGGVEVADVRKLRAVLMKHRKYDGVTFNAINKTYNIVIQRLPMCMGVHAVKTQCEDSGHVKDKVHLTHDCGCYPATVAWTTPATIRKAMVSLATLTDTELEAFAQEVSDYAAATIEALELRALFNNKKLDPEDFMRRLRHSLTEYYSRANVRASFVGKARGSHSTRANDISRDLTQALGFLFLVTRPVPGSSMAGSSATDERDFPKAFDLVVGKGDAALCPWSTSWFVSEETWLQHWVGDHERGVICCPECVAALVCDVQRMLEASDSAWVSVVFSRSEDTELAPWCEPGPTAALYSVHPQLAIRVPTGAHFLESTVVTGQEAFLVTGPTLLFDVLPVIAKQMALESMLEVLRLSNAGEEQHPSLFIARFLGNARIGKLIAEIDQPIRQVTRPAVLRQCRQSMTTISGVLSHARVTRPTRALGDDAYESARLEAATTWHDEIRNERATMHSLVDIEDLFAADGPTALTPPCMRHAIKTSRAANWMGNEDRFTMAHWMADMNIDGDAAVRVTGIAGSEGERDFRGRVNGAIATRLAKSTQGERAKSLSCLDNMNRSNPCTTACPMRQQTLGTSDRGGKVTAAEALRVRWKCTATLATYQEGSYPKFSISHPIDYVVLQRRHLKL